MKWEMGSEKWDHQEWELGQKWEFSSIKYTPQDNAHVCELIIAFAHELQCSNMY